MKESVAIAKEGNTKNDLSLTRSDKSIHHVRNEAERKLGSLRSVIDNIRHDAVEGIATELSSMHTAQHASVLLALQRTHGNRYVQRVMAGIQAKLKVGQPGDVYEQEADRVAEHVIRMPEPEVSNAIRHRNIQKIRRACIVCEEDELLRQLEEEKKEEDLIQNKSIAEQITPFIKRHVEEEKEESLQTKAHSPHVTEVTSIIESRIQSLKGGGQSLPEADRSFMERRFGVAFRGIRIHSDAESSKLNRSLQAHAFTVGQDIFFRQWAYNTGSHQGEELIAQELTHVVQQEGAAQFRAPGKTVSHLDQPQVIQRTTPAEAESSVLRAAMLEAIRDAMTVTRDQAVRHQLDQLRGRIPTMSTPELRNELPAIEQMATQAASTVAASVPHAPLTQRSTQSTADPLSDPDTVIRENREYNLFRTIEFISSSNAISAINIRQMLHQMQRSLTDIVWYTINIRGIAARAGLDGIPPGHRVVVQLGPAALLLMQSPNESILPVMSHEIYHAYEQFRLQARGSLPARPNLSREEMVRRIQILSGTPLAPGTSREALALDFVRYNESEIYSELVEHSALQNPTLRGSVPPGGRQLIVGIVGGSYQITINSLTQIEGEVQNRLELLRTVMGSQDGGAIARGLLTRAGSEGWLHADTVSFFDRAVHARFP